jgi:hypothetical protein
MKLMERSNAVLRVVLYWIQAHCVIPDGDDQGTPFLLGSDQARFVGRHYLVSGAVVSKPKKPVDAFVFRRSQLVRAQKWGKSPLIAAFTCVEGCGPVVFCGWAESGDVYDCRDFGCGCGFVYEYAPGEPMGMPWATPLIQITATSEDQTDNTYDALRPMIEKGPLAELIPKTGEEFIRLPGGGRIDTVTSKATSRLGQRITFAAQDETGLWTASNGGHKLSQTQRRGLAGMGGRSIETTNAWDPAEDSVAQRTFESGAPDINKDFEQPPKTLDFQKPDERRKIFEFNYRHAPWVSVDAVEREAVELMEKDPADAERFFGNRIVPGQGRWLKTTRWAALESGYVPGDGTKVCLGFDGSDNDDYTGIRLETLDYFQFTPSYSEGRKTLWKPQDWAVDGKPRIPRSEVRAAVAEICTRFNVVRAYCDPEIWETDIDEWAAAYGEKVFIKWPTNSTKRMWASLERFRNDVYDEDTKFRHDADEDVAAHIGNAVVRARGMDALTKQRVYILGKASEPQKIDMAMSSVLAHEAVCDAIAAGLNSSDDPEYVYF